MKRIWPVAFGLLALTGCLRRKVDTTTSSSTTTSATAVMDADRAFSAMSAEKGMAVSFLQFADSNVIKLRNNQTPIMSKKELESSFGAGAKEDFELTWEPVRGEIAQSGEMGWTFGNWKMRTHTKAGKDTTLYGNYMTVWKKQPDGSWKYIMDGGGNTPAPAGS